MGNLLNKKTPIHLSLQSRNILIEIILVSKPIVDSFSDFMDF